MAKRFCGMAHYYLGLDLGTTSVKACCFDADWRMVVERIGHYPLEHPAPGAAVQDPELLRTTAEQTLASALAACPETPLGIGLSCPMHSLLLLDKNHRPLTELITWADTRAQAVMDRWTPAEKTELLRRGGTPVHPMSPFVKLRWLRDQHPELLARAVYLSDLKSYLVNCWTENGLLIDEQLASASGFFDLKTNGWAENDYDLRLPEVVPADFQLRANASFGQICDLGEVPLFIGGSDGCLANFSSKLPDPRTAALTIGTSGAVRVTHRGFKFNPEHTLFNYKLYGDRYVLGGATNNGGKALEWVYGLLEAHFVDIGTMIKAAIAAPDTDLRFEPFLNGERAPLWDATATATFVGLRGSHGPADLARAVLLGVTDNIVAILRQIEAVTGELTEIRASGGFTRSAAWVELLEKRCGRRVVVAETPQASAAGAAMVAAGLLTE